MYTSPAQESILNFNLSVMAATRWGIAGAGRISFDFANAVSSLSDGHIISAVAARDKARAQEFADKFDIHTAFGSYEELAASTDTVDVIYVADVVRLMLSNGKSVLCEKPLGLTLKQTQEMITLAREKKVFFMEGIWSRTFPVYKRITELLEKETIGQPLNVSASFGQRDRHLPGKRLTLKANGGGTVLDYGVYCVQFIINVFRGERPTKVIATTVGLNEDGVDLGVSVTIHFSKSRIASFTTELRVELPNEAHIVGSKGRIQVDCPFWCPTDMFVQLDTTKERETFPLPGGPFKHPFQLGNSQGLIYEAEEVRRCLSNNWKESPLMTLEESLIISEIQDEINRQIGVSLE